MKVKNKKIAIVGGVGPQATQVLYEKIIELAQVRYGAKDRVPWRFDLRGSN